MGEEGVEGGEVVPLGGQVEGREERERKNGGRIVWLSKRVGERRRGRRRVER
jgi:hypothetical protein